MALDAKERELDQHLTWAKQSMVNIIDDPTNKKLAYVLHRDLCQKAVNGNGLLNMLLIQAKDASMNVRTVSKSDLFKEEDEEDVVFIAEDDGIILDEAMDISLPHSGNQQQSQSDIKEETTDQDQQTTPLSPFTGTKRTVESAYETSRDNRHQIQLLRSNGRFNQIHIKSNDGPANVFLLNQLPEVIPDESGLPKYKKAKMDRLQQLIMEQKEEQKTRVAVELAKAEEDAESMAILLAEKKTLEETRAALGEASNQQEQPEEEKPDVEELAKSSQEAPNTRSRKVTRKVAAPLLPSRHLSPRRAAQHHLFCPTSRSKTTGAPDQLPVLATKSSSRRKSSKADTSATQQAASQSTVAPVPEVVVSPASPQIKEEIHDENSNTAPIIGGFDENSNTSNKSDSAPPTMNARKRGRQVRNLSFDLSVCKAKLLFSTSLLHSLHNGSHRNQVRTLPLARMEHSPPPPSKGRLPVVRHCRKCRLHWTLTTSFFPTFTCHFFASHHRPLCTTITSISPTMRVSLICSSESPRGIDSPSPFSLLKQASQVRTVPLHQTLANIRCYPPSPVNVLCCSPLLPFWQSFHPPYITRIMSSIQLFCPIFQSKRNIIDKWVIFYERQRLLNY